MGILDSIFGDAPEAPDPKETAEAQYELNRRTAAEQQRLAMMGQDTDLGSLSYVPDPSSPSGFRAVQSLSPEQQALLMQSQDLQGNYGSLAGEQLGRVSDTMSTPFSFDAGRAKILTDMNQKFLDPQWAQREDSMKTDLMNRGIREGTPQWASMMNDFEGQRSNAYDKMFLDSYDKANNAALVERNVPINDLNSLGAGAFPMGTQDPGFRNTPAPGVAASDIIGPTMDAYKQQVASYNAGQGALGSIAGMALGGWAQGGFKMPKFS